MLVKINSLKNGEVGTWLPGGWSFRVDAKVFISSNSVYLLTNQKGLCVSIINSTNVIHGKYGFVL